MTVINVDFARASMIRDVAKHILGERSDPAALNAFARGYEARLDGKPAPTYGERMSVYRRAGWDAADITLRANEGSET